MPRSQRPFATGSPIDVCVSTERIYVDEKVHDRFVDLLVKRVEKMPVGDGLESGVKVGPMVNAR